jgi:hypothetical protein
VEVPGLELAMTTTWICELDAHGKFTSKRRFAGGQTTRFFAGVGVKMKCAPFPGPDAVVGSLPGIHKAKSRAAGPGTTSHGGCHDKA